jgi:hypothetical protein
MIKIIFNVLLMWGSLSLSDEKASLSSQLPLIPNMAVISGPKFRGTHDNIIFSGIRHSSNLELQIPQIIPHPQELGTLLVVS